MQKIYQKINLWFFCLVLIFIPFQALIFEYSTKKLLLSPHFSFWAAHWYEPFILLFAIVNFASFLKKGIKKTEIWQLSLFLLLLLGILSVFFFAPHYKQGIEGFRVTLFFLVALFQPSIDSKQFKKALLVYASLASIIALWAIIERLLAPNYWSGLINAARGFGYGDFLVGMTRRSCSFFSGPNQLGSYLLPAPFIFLSKASEENRSKLYLAVNYLLYGVIVLAIGFSYSRIALAGLVTGVLWFSIKEAKNNYRRFWLLLFSLVLILIPVIISFSNGNTLQTVSTHDTSQIGHNEAIVTSISEMKSRIGDWSKMFLGSGLATAGPMAFKYSGGIISESWYLQVALELGVAGLILWIILTLALLAKLYTRSFLLFLGTIAVSTAALFLHTFADNPAVSYSLFILIGLALAQKETREVK